MTLTDYDTAAELSATAADIAAAIADGRTPTAADVDHARDMLDTLAVLTGGPAAGSLADFADTVTGHLRAHFDPATLPVQQVLALAEEAGEFTAAYRRWAGMARRPGGWDDVCAELADVVITAHVTARVLGIDLDAAWRAKAAVVLSRGWRNQTPR
jgi:NTP pyrophosphatase (non-canonical NTP hydrolase)